jgi:hypothetical protein
MRLFAGDLRNEFFTAPRHMTRALEVVITVNSRCNLRATRERFEGLRAMHQLAPKSVGCHPLDIKIGIATSSCCLLKTDDCLIYFPLTTFYLLAAQRLTALAVHRHWDRSSCSQGRACCLPISERFRMASSPITPADLSLETSSNDETITP